jgi:glutaminase
VQEEAFDGKFDEIADVLRNVCPTAVVLHNCIEIIKHKRRISDINRLIAYLTKSSEKIGKYSDRVLKNYTTYSYNVKSIDRFSVHLLLIDAMSSFRQVSLIYFWSDLKCHYII